MCGEILTSGHFRALRGMPLIAVGERERTPRSSRRVALSNDTLRGPVRLRRSLRRRAAMHLVEWVIFPPFLIISLFINYIVSSFYMLGVLCKYLHVGGWIIVHAWDVNYLMCIDIYS